MINLVEQATILAHDIDKPFDFALKRRLIATYISGRAMLLRRSITSNRAVPAECIQSFAVPIEKADTLSSYYIDNYKVSVKTKETIPVPIRINSPEPFISVSTMDGSINYAYSDLMSIRSNSTRAGKFVSGTGRYIYHGQRIGVYHNEGTLLSTMMILVRGLFEQPLEVHDYSNLYTYNETHFPMPLDMATEIRNLILSGELKIVPESQTIPINNG